MYVNLYCKVPVPSFASQFSFIFSPALALAGTEKDVIDGTETVSDTNPR